MINERPVGMVSSTTSDYKFRHASEAETPDLTLYGGNVQVVQQGRCLRCSSASTDKWRVITQPEMGQDGSVTMIHVWVGLAA